MKCRHEPPVYSQFSFEIAVDSFQAVVGFGKAARDEEHEEGIGVGRQKPPPTPEIPMGVPPLFGASVWCLGFFGEHIAPLISPCGEGLVPKIHILPCLDAPESMGDIPQSTGCQKGTAFREEGHCQSRDMSETPLVREFTEGTNDCLDESPFPVTHDPEGEMSIQTIRKRPEVTVP